MPSAPDLIYFQPSLGSLTGFDSISLTTPPTGIEQLPLQGWSIETLRAFLLNFNEMNFPSKSWIIQVEDDIINHLDNVSNPHNVTLDQINASLIGDVLPGLIPGTVPYVAPFYAFYATNELPLTDIVPATHTSTNMYRLTRAGQFVDPSTEVVNVGSDYIIGDGGIPLFAPYTNLIPTNWEPTLVLTNVTATLDTTSDLGYMPSPAYLIEEQDAVGSFSTAIPIALVANTTYSMVWFIAPQVQNGYLRVYFPNNPTLFAVVPFNSVLPVTNTTNPMFDIRTMPNGNIRVAVTFNSGSTPATSIVMAYSDYNDVWNNRVGFPSRPIYSISSPVLSTSSALQPIPIVSGVTTSSSTFVPSMNLVTTATALPDITIALDLYMAPSIAGTVMTDTTLLAMDKLLLARDAINIVLYYNGTQLFTAPIVQGLNSIAVSYSSSEIILLTNNSQRQTVTGAYGSLLITSPAVGPCGGYLLSLTMYAMADGDHCLEFLLND